MFKYEYKGKKYTADNKEEVVHYFGLAMTSKNLKQIKRVPQGKGGFYITAKRKNI